MKVEYFPTKNWYSSKRNRSYLRTVSCHGIEKLLQCKCQVFGWLCTLYTGLAKNIKFEIVGCLETLEDCK